MCAPCWQYLDPLRFENPEYLAQLRRIANLRWATREGAIRLPQVWSVA